MSAGHFFRRAIIFSSLMSAASFLPMLGTLPLVGSLSWAFADSKPTIAVAKRWNEVKAPPLRKVKWPKPKRIQLENGMIIFLQPDDELPIVQMSISVQGGLNEEPADKVGLMDIYEDVWRSGGTKTKTGEQLDDYFESQGIYASASAGAERTSLSFSSLKQDFEGAFTHNLDILRNPMFREEKITLVKRKILTALASANDTAASIAGREAAYLVYGKNHPVARTADYTTLHAIKREDLLRWHKEHLYPNRILLSVFGDFDPDQMEARLRREFSSWKRGPDYVKPTLPFSATKPGIFFVSKKNTNQSSIHFVQLGQIKTNPDFYAIKVLNQILSGNSMSGRLFEHLRTQQGLAYSTSGGIGTGWNIPGVYSLRIATKSQTTVKAILAMYKELDDLIKRPPLEKEVEEAKDRILNSFVFEFVDKGDVLADQVNLELHGYPKDWTERYPEEIRKVTAVDVHRVIQKYLNPKGFAVLVVGNEKDFDKPLSTLGPVTEVDPTIQLGPKE